MRLFKTRQTAKTAVAVTQTGAQSNPFGLLDRYVPLSTPQSRLYYSLREAVPVIDAAIFKIVRLASGFEVKCRNAKAQAALDTFLQSVPVGGN